MSKELETLEKLLSFAFVMGENMVGLTKGNYDEGAFIKKTYEYLHKYSVDLHSRLELKQALQRLESIDNVDPNEALAKFKDNTEMFEEIALEDSHSYKEDTVIEAYVYHFNNIIIERALLKMQELEKENTEYKRAFNVIWEKPKQSEATIVYITATIRPTYEDYCLVIRDEYRLTEEEFDLLNEISKDIRGE